MNRSGNYYARNRRDPKSKQPARPPPIPAQTTTNIARVRATERPRTSQTVSQSVRSFTETGQVALHEQGPTPHDRSTGKSPGTFSHVLPPTCQPDDGVNIQQLSTAASR